jgi:hypothetical protein
MLYGITFQYTKGRAYFAGTDELNLEGSGVVPDVRVPTTLETVEATLQGEDPVLAAGVEVLRDLAGQAFADSINLVPLPDETATAYTTLYPDGWTLSVQSRGIQAVSPNQQYILNYIGPSTDDVATSLAPLGVTDPESILAETREANDLSWSIYGPVDVSGFRYRVAITSADGMTYMVSIGAPVATADYMLEGLLYPLVDDFVPAEAN